MKYPQAIFRAICCALPLATLPLATLASEVVWYDGTHAVTYHV